MTHTTRARTQPTRPPFFKADAMPLFHVQDSDRPMWVIADNFQQAHNRWAEKVAKENDMSWRDIDPPHGIAHICDDDDLLLP